MLVFEVSAAVIVKPVVLVIVIVYSTIKSALSPSSSEGADSDDHIKFTTIFTPVAVA